MKTVDVRSVEKRLPSSVVRLGKYLLRKYKRAVFGFDDWFAFPFPIDFERALPADAPSVLAGCCEALEKLQVRFVVATGTALGLYRDGKLIAHDNDIDIDLLGALDEREILSEFDSLGLTLCRRVAYRGRLRQLIFRSPSGVPVDLCFWERIGPYVYHYLPELGGLVRRHPHEFYEDLTTTVFNGRAYPLPARTDEWLALQYGDWRTPKSVKGDWRQESRDIVRPTPSVGRSSRRPRQY